MRKRESINTDVRLTVDINELMGMLSLGRTSSIELANKAGAVIKFGTRNLYSVKKIESYIESLTESKPTMLEG